MKTSSRLFILKDYKKCSLRIRDGLPVLLSVAVLSLGAPALAGSKWLNVVLIDRTENGVGKASFKVMRASGYQDECWQSFAEIAGIRTTHIDNVPPALDSAVRRASRAFGAARGPRDAWLAIEPIRQQVQTAGLDGVYVFVSDGGRQARIYGISRVAPEVSEKDRGGLWGVLPYAMSQPIKLSGNTLIDQQTLSKRLCEASKVMD